jgi:hypothetical protein
MILRWTLALGLLTGALSATPTRILTIDNGNQIIPDDWDAVTYYSLAPNFKDHLYFDTYSDGSSFGWAFLDIKLGTLVLWWNKPFEAGGLYEAALGHGALLGYSSTAFGTVATQAWEPRENRISIPDNKLAIGYALSVTEAFNLGLCIRIAQLEQLSEAENRGAGGAPQAYGASLAGLVDGAGGHYGVQDAWKYQQRQASSGLIVGPQFSYFGERLTLDGKLDLIWVGVDNSHSESLVSADGTGSVTQSLKDKPHMSWQLKPRLRWMLNDASSLVLRGSYSDLGFNTEHRRSGSFSGAGFSPLQLGGYDHVDAAQDLSIRQWEAFAGYLRTWDRGRHSVVLGAGVKQEQAQALNQSWQIRSSPSSYNDLVPAQREDRSSIQLQVPVLMGAELGLTPWARARGMLSRNWYSREESQQTRETYAADGTLSGVSKARTLGDEVAAWTLAMGFGLNFGDFGWDTALNTGLLGSPTGAAFVNPLYQSSFSYRFR